MLLFPIPLVYYSQKTFHVFQSETSVFKFLQRSVNGNLMAFEAFSEWKRCVQIPPA